MTRTRGSSLTTISTISKKKEQNKKIEFTVLLLFIKLQMSCFVFTILWFYVFFTVTTPTRSSAQPKNNDKPSPFAFEN